MILLPVLLQSAPLTQSQCVARFDKALRTRDGALLRSVMHPKIVAASPASGAGLATFLRTYFWPALAKTGVTVQGKGFVPLSSPGNMTHFVFFDSGRVNTVIRNPGDKAPIFTPATIKTPDGYRVVTDYARLIFFAADRQADSPTRNGYEEMLDSQGLVEAWAPRLQALGIRGGFDGIASPFQPWKVLLPAARKEVEAMRKGG